MSTPVHYGAYTPQEATEMTSRAGVAKGNMRPDKVFFSGFLAGCMISFVSAVILIINTSPWFSENAPGVLKLLAAIVFPIALVMITLTGADLATGTFLYTTVAVLHRRLSVWKMLLHWVLCFFGNLAGCLFTLAIIIGYGGVLEGPYAAEAVSFAEKKGYDPQWHQIFLRGIGCNWLVTLACFMAFLSREIGGKIMAIWWPVFTFVILGFDHVVANMFLVTAGIWYGSDKLTVGFYIWHSMIPALIGNIIGGGGFVGVAYWYMFLTGETTPVSIDGSNFYPPGEAPLDRQRWGQRNGQGADEHSESDGKTNEAFVAHKGSV